MDYQQALPKTQIGGLDSNGLAGATGTTGGLNTYPQATGTLSNYWWWPQPWPAWGRCPSCGKCLSCGH